LDLIISALIQAKEAQRLRSRRRAEKRLLDMQMRQKQRVEEVRETQKKVRIYITDLVIFGLALPPINFVSLCCICCLYIFLLKV
jgi:hypothetical protein